MSLAIATAALLAAVALVLLALGLRGRRTDDHPLCRRCGYDLTGRAAGAGLCPECGADLARPRALRIGHRQRRRGPLSAGVGLLASLLIAGGVVGWEAAHRPDWQRRLLRHAPLGYLLRRASSAIQSDRALPINELLDRSRQGRLSAADWSRVAEAGLAYQADVAKPWDPLWGQLVEGAGAAGRLSDDQWHRYAHQAWPQRFQLDIRPAVRRGDPLPIMLWVMSGRVAPDSVLQLQMDDPTLSWVGMPPRPATNHHDPEQDAIRGFPWVRTMWGVGTPLPPADFPPGLVDGPQHVHVTAPYRVGTVDAAGQFHPQDGGTVDIPATVTLFPADHPTVQMVRDPSLADTIRRAIRVRPQRGSMDLRVDGTPVGLSFDVLLRQPGRPDTPVGTVVWAAASAGSLMANPIDHVPMLGRGTVVDVVFRSDPAPATRTTDVTQAWDGELVYPGLVVP